MPPPMPQQARERADAAAKAVTRSASLRAKRQAALRRRSTAGLAPTAAHRRARTGRRNGRARSRSPPRAAHRQRRAARARARRRCATRSSAARRSPPNSRRPKRSAPTMPDARAARAVRGHAACRAAASAGAGAARADAGACSRLPARRRAAGGFLDRLQANASSWCASARRTRRPATMPSAVLARLEVDAAQADIAARARPTRQAARCDARAGRLAWIAKAQGAAGRARRRRVNSPPTPRARSDSRSGADDPRRRSSCWRSRCSRAGVVWVADRPGRGRHHLAGLPHRDLGDGGGARARRAGDRRSSLLWSIVRAILRSPEQVSLFLRHRRGVHGYLAISRGLIAIGAGDLRAARRAADDAARISPGEPLALLLNAQIGAAGRRPRRAPSTRSAPWPSATTPSCSACAGSISRRSGATMRGGARLSPRRRPRPRRRSAWAGQAVLDFRCAAGDWAGALDGARPQHASTA